MSDKTVETVETVETCKGATGVSNEPAATNSTKHLKLKTANARLPRRAVRKRNRKQSQKQSQNRKKVAAGPIADDVPALPDVVDISSDSESDDDMYSDSDTDDEERKMHFFRPRNVDGFKLPPYRLTRFVAHGGFANIFVARSLRKARTRKPPAEVIIKVFRKDKPEQLETELALMRKIKSPSVIQMMKESRLRLRNDSFQYCVLPKYDMDLKTLIKKVCLTEEEVNTVMVQAVTGVMTIHDAGFLHYDLKPENMLVNYDIESRQFKQLVVSDLGSAVRPNTKGLPPDWGFSLSYAAPEQLTRCRACVNWQTDVFALGCIFYELLCGNNLFLKSHDDDIYHMAEIRALNLQEEFPVEMKGNRKFFNAYGNLKYNAMRIMMASTWLDNCQLQLQDGNPAAITFIQDLCHVDSRKRPTMSDILEFFAPPTAVMSAEALTAEIDSVIATTDAQEKVFVN